MKLAVRNAETADTGYGTDDLLNRGAGSSGGASWSRRVREELQLDERVLAYVDKVKVSIQCKPLQRQ